MNRMNVLFWFREQKALVRHLSDAHRALRIADLRIRERDQRIADLEVDLADATATSMCPGRAEHVRLAHRVEVAELQARGLAPVFPLSPIRIAEFEARKGQDLS